MIQSLEGYYTVPVMAQRDMTPFSKTQDNPKGFPSFREEAVNMRLDLSRALIRHPAVTYFILTNEKAMRGSGILPGDIVLVEKGREPRSGDLILAYYEGEFIIRRIFIQNVYPQLLADEEDYPRIEIEPDNAFAIWGVVIDLLKL